MQIIIEVFIPVFLIVMMLVVGMDLSLEDFQQVRRSPKIILLSSLSQLLLLPLAGFGIIWVLEPSQVVLTGIVLVSASPGGAISNYYVFLARANIALSITLTATSTLLAFITFPLVVAIGFRVFLAAEEEISVPVWSIISQLFLLLLLPTVIGMWLRVRFPYWVSKKTKLLRFFSLILLALMICFVIIDQIEVLVAHLQEILMAATIYTLTTMAIGWGTGAVIKTDQTDRFSLSVEFGVRNLAAVTVVGSSLLGHTELVIFAAGFFLVQTPMLLVAIIFQRRVHRKLPY